MGKVGFAEKEDWVRQKYDRLSGVYDRRWRSYVQSSLHYLLRAIPLEGSETVLDVACGTGAFETLLMERHEKLRVVGVDVSEKMLSVARSKLETHPRVFLTRASALVLPFRDESFDLAVCTSALHYFEDPLKFLKEVKRVVKKSGRVVIMDWCGDDLVTRLRDWVHRIRDLAHHRCCSQKELRHFLGISGWRVVSEKKFRTGFLWHMMLTESVKMD